MAEKSARQNDDQSDDSNKDFLAGYEGEGAAVQTAPKQEEPKEKPKPDEASKADPAEKPDAKVDEAGPKHVTLTQEQFDKLNAAADETASLKSQMSKAFGTIGNMQQLLNKLQEATPKGADIKLSRAIVAKLEKDFPELADGQYDAFEQFVKLINESGVKGTGDKPATKEPTTRELQVESLEDAYPDWKEIVGAVEDGKFDPKHPFRSWLATQTEEYQQKINATENAAVIERAIRRFKASEAEKARAAKKPEAPKPDPKAAGRREMLRDGVQPRGSGRTPEPAKTAQDAFREGYESG